MSAADDLLDQMDSNMRRAFLCAMEAGAFICSAMQGSDNHHALESSTGKPESKPPTGLEHAWAYHRAVGLLREVEATGVRVVTRIDEGRSGSRSSKPKDVPGRPTLLTAGIIREAGRMRDSGMSVTAVARSGLVPVRSFWRYLERGKIARVGLEYDLYLTMKTKGDEEDEHEHRRQD